MKALIVISVIIAVLALILLLPIRFKVFLLYNDDGFTSYMTLKYGIFRIPLKKKKTAKKESSEGKKPKQKSSVMQVLPDFIKQNLQETKDLIVVILKRLLSKTVSIDKLYINVVLGFEDAMNTGIIYGAVSGFIYNIVGVMDKQMKLKKHDISLKPDFNVPHILAELEAIISTNIFNAIVIVVVALVGAGPLYKKLKKMTGEMNNVKSD